LSDQALRDLVLTRLEKDTHSCRLTAQGFRGIGPPATLDLTPGPGLTLVVGRNGSGKSSFAEGLELPLTGDTYRWSQRSKVWRDGWRNLPSACGRGPQHTSGRTMRSSLDCVHQLARNAHPERVRGLVGRFILRDGLAVLLRLLTSWRLKPRGRGGTGGFPARPE
jgi:hypothetical protein